MKSILIVEDDLTFSHLLKAWFTKKKFDVRTAISFSEAKKKFIELIPDIVICDLRLPKDSGLTILEWIKSKHPDTVVIMMTGYADIQSAVMAIKLGAFDYISKPFNPEELFNKINQALPPDDAEKKDRIKKQVKKSPVTNDKSIVNAYIKGTSESFKKLYHFVDLVAPTKLTVLIKGESGVGKEHIARMIHEKSDYSTGPFVAVDCGVISKELAASDFFGHIKGAFTGAIENKTGYFLSANKGTLFLDEIGNLPVNIQTQLLRVLQEMKIKQVGTEKDIDIDVRVLTATNEDVDFAVNNGYFRSDLYHRISEFILDVPSLKDSRDDISIYLRHFLSVSNKMLKRNIVDFTPEAMQILINYEWPGNIRELKNIVNRLTLMTAGEYITEDVIPDHFKQKHVNQDDVFFDIDEKIRIEDALRLASNDVLKAASILSIDVKSLYIKLKIYNLKYG